MDEVTTTTTTFIEIDEEEIAEQEGYEILIAVGVLLLICATAYLHKRFEKYLTVLPLASLCILVGCGLGVVLWTSEDLDRAFSFRQDFFFNVLLPPCIFAAGFELDKEVFFHNLGSIVVLAFVGTFISSVVIGFGFHIYCNFVDIDMPVFDSLAFGSLISAVDPVATIVILSNVGVHKRLYMLIFGESVLNDAVSIILFRTFHKLATTTESINVQSEFFNGMGETVITVLVSFAVGVTTGSMQSLIFKYIKFDTPDHQDSIIICVEICIFVLTSMAPYYIAEFLDYSGIMALLFAGIWSNKYSIHHVSFIAEEFIEYLIMTSQFLAEHFLFTYLGMAIFTIPSHDFELDVFGCGIFLCLIGRALAVYPLCAILNCFRTNTIKIEWQLLMWFSGLRGPVAFALALMCHTLHSLVESTTLLIVFLTTIVFGGATHSLVNWLDLKSTPMMRAKSLSLCDIPDDKYWDSNHWWITLDKTYLTPCFGASHRPKRGSGIHIGRTATWGSEELENHIRAAIKDASKANASSRLETVSLDSFPQNSGDQGGAFDYYRLDKENAFE